MQNTLFMIGTTTLAGIITAASDAIDAATHVPLGAALSVAAVVVPASWWLAAKFRSFDDRMDNQDKQLEEIRKSLSRLPCEKRNGCKDE